MSQMGHQRKSDTADAISGFTQKRPLSVPSRSPSGPRQSLLGLRPAAREPNTISSVDHYQSCAGVSSMRSFLSICGLALALLGPSSAQAHSRGFAWFFAHSRPQGACSGQHVVATFYVSGRRTASGQTFDSNGYTAAHRTLPFGSQVMVTNPQNGNSITVVINDRGPFTRGVTLDLSRGAARAIGMRGTQWVCML
jgi:rare lipoprotein A